LKCPFSFILFAGGVKFGSADRGDDKADAATRLVIKDPPLAKMMDPKSMPFDVKRMLYGGFKVLVDA
jgi:uncharacterized protein YbaA (DUF1428 family)